jgi:hypothetical protein
VQHRGGEHTTEATRMQRMSQIHFSNDRVG